MPVTITISYPPAPGGGGSTNVPGSGNFVTFGSAFPQPVPLGAWVVDPNNPNNIVAVGVRVDTVNPPNWAFTFTNVPPGTPFNLVVRGLAPDGSTGLQQVSITCVP